MSTDDKTFLQFHDISMTSETDMPIIIKVKLKLFVKF